MCFWILCLDLIVGAPHQNGGQGAVFVYEGSKDGIVQKAVQVGSSIISCLM